MDSALAGRVSTALSVVTELNFPLSGTITVASATHNPITNHGTHRPANRPAGAFPDGAALTAINSLLHTGYIAYLVPASYRANLRRLLNGAQAGWPTQGPSARTSAVASQVLPERQGPGDTAVGPDQQRVDVHRSVRAVTVLTRPLGRAVPWCHLPAEDEAAVRRNRTESGLAFRL
ncbi:hypothetical protein GCM10027575_67160 [Phytohabitans suffuscus]